MSNCIWVQELTVEELQKRSHGSFSDLLGIEFTQVGRDFLEARMKVEPRLHQPHGILHGGVSVALAETVGSIAANCAVDQSRIRCVGQAINASHLRPVSSGFIRARATPFSIGERSHVWGIEIRNEAGDLTCVSRLTMALLAREIVQ
jgi:1,4-dihydroxy-2-naphthoyl-CoA hydrolase